MFVCHYCRSFSTWGMIQKHKVSKGFQLKAVGVLLFYRRLAVFYSSLEFVFQCPWPSHHPSWIALLVKDFKAPFEEYFSFSETSHHFFLQLRIFRQDLQILPPPTQFRSISGDQSVGGISCPCARPVRCSAGHLWIPVMRRPCVGG